MLCKRWLKWFLKSLQLRLKGCDLHQRRKTWNSALRMFLSEKLRLHQIIWINLYFRGLWRGTSRPKYSGTRSPECQGVQTTKLGLVAPNICWFSVLNFCHATQLACRILRWLLTLWKICTRRDPVQSDNQGLFWRWGMRLLGNCIRVLYQPNAQYQVRVNSEYVFP